MLVALAHIAGVDPVFGQRLGASRVVRQQAVSVVVKVADQRHIDAHAIELLTDVGHGLGSLWRIDGDSNHFGASNGKLFDLNGRTNRVDRVGIGHRLNPDWRGTTHGDDP